MITERMRTAKRFRMDMRRHVNIALLAIRLMLLLLLLLLIDWVEVNRLYFLMLLLVMLLAKDERADHAECRSFDQVSLADVAAEAPRVEQMVPSAHHQLVRLERFAAFGALFAAAEQSISIDIVIIGLT